jgi:uncharacterized protein (TIGR02147 family)
LGAGACVSGRRAVCGVRPPDRNIICALPVRIGRRDGRALAGLSCYIRDMNVPKVTAYLDYRAFLQDWCAWQKTLRSGFSLRAFSVRLGLGGTSFLSAVLKGKKNLGEEVRLRLALQLELAPDEESYFHLLVQFNQAKEMETKNHLFRQMQKYQASRARVAGEGQYRFYSQWFYAAVWNYFGIEHREKEPGRIAQALRPALSADQVEEAIAVLLELGLVRKLANGYEACEQHWTTEPEVASLAVKTHVLDLIRLSAEQLERVPAPERQYNTLMFHVSSEGFVAIRDRMRQFQEELRDILDRDKGEDSIYTLSMALFPLTASRNKK